MNLGQSKERANRIALVEMSLRQINQDTHRVLDQQAFVIDICERFMCSDRMAKEYIRIAKSRIKEWLK